MLKLARRFLPVILIPRLITAKKKSLVYLHRSDETPITTLKAIAIAGFFYLLFASGRSVGRVIFIQSETDRYLGTSLLLNIWLLLAGLIYSFAIPIALTELFLNPDHDLISASPYSRLKTLLGRLVGIGFKIWPTALILMVPTIALSTQLIPLGMIEIIFIVAFTIYLPSAFAMISSILFMALVPSTKMLRRVTPILFIVLLLIPIGMPRVSKPPDISQILTLTELNSLSPELANPSHSLGGILNLFVRHATGGSFGSSLLSIFIIVTVALIPIAACLLISYPLYGVAIVGSHRLRSIKLPLIRPKFAVTDSIASVASVITVKLIRVLVALLSSSRGASDTATSLPEKFIKAFLRQESFSILRDPFKLFHLALLVIFSLIYLASMPEILSKSKFSVEFASVINFALVSLLVASFANRFVITSFSREGEANWIVKTSPLTSRQIIVSRFISWCMLLVPSGLLMGLAGSVMVNANLAQGAMLALVITASVPSLISSALSSGVRLGNLPGSSTDGAEFAAGSQGLTMIFAMTSAAAIVCFNATLYLMIQLAHGQSLTLLWLGVFLLINMSFTKARLAIGVDRYNQQSAAI